MYLRNIVSCVLVLVLLLLIGITMNQSITVMAENNFFQNKRTIIIDAGHGGMDGGAVSCTGTYESKINLEIALRLNDLFHILGYQTVMIRDTDRSIHTSGDTIAQMKLSDLKERVRMVNETDHAFLISIHQNYFTQSKYHGAQVFYKADSVSAELANTLQKNICETINPGSSRKAKESTGVYLMKHIQNSGILVECGFLSNPEEEQRLRTPEYQKKICCVIATTAATFFQTLDREYSS